MLSWKYNKGLDINGLESKLLEKGDEFVFVDTGISVNAIVLQATKYKDRLPEFEGLERDIVIATDEGELRRYYAGEFICDAYPIGTV